MVEKICSTHCSWPNCGLPGCIVKHDKPKFRIEKESVGNARFTFLIPVNNAATLICERGFYKIWFDATPHNAIFIQRGRIQNGL